MILLVELGTAIWIGIICFLSGAVIVGLFVLFMDHIRRHDAKGRYNPAPVQSWGEDFITNMGVKMRVHKRGDCHTTPCPIHSPSNHHMRGWPMHWRGDLKIFERLCAHGIGHPDPDCPMENGQGVHGCDGCCHPPSS